MSVLGTRENMEPANATEAATAHYTRYGDFGFFDARIAALQQRFAPSGQKLLIAGCGWGFLVARAVAVGYDAWGCDASAYCVAQASRAGAAGRVIGADITSDAALRAVATAAGIVGGNPRFDLLVTEDVLPCLSDAEVTAALTALRARCRTNLLHLVTCLRPDWRTEESATDQGRRAADLASRDPVFNWKTLADWQAILSPPDVVLDTQEIR